MKNILLLISVAALASGCVVAPPDNGSVSGPNGGGYYDGGSYDSGGSYDNGGSYDGGGYGRGDGGYYRNHDDHRDGDRYRRRDDRREGDGYGYDHRRDDQRDGNGYASGREGYQPPPQQQYDQRMGGPQAVQPVPANAARGVYMRGPNAPQAVPAAVNAPPRPMIMPGAAAIFRRPPQQMMRPQPVPQQMRAQPAPQAGGPGYGGRGEHGRGHGDDHRDERWHGDDRGQ